MKNSTNKTFVLSHSSSGYDFTGNIDRLIDDYSTRMWIKSYISLLTEYASLPGYIAAPVTTKSYFCTGDHVIFTESYPQKDSRMFLESKVTIDTKQNNLDFVGFFNSGIDCSVPESTFFNKLREAFLTAFVSEQTVIYCITRDDSEVNVVRQIISDFSQKLLKSNSCIEVIGEIPSVKTSAVICRCILSQDKSMFLNEIKRKDNCITVDLTAEKPTIDICIDTPTYAQRCLTHLFSKYNFENIYYSIEEIENLPIDATRKNAYYNTLCFLMAYQNFRADSFVVPATINEKNEINSLLKEVEIL